MSIYSRILVPIDASSTAQTAAEQAVALARDLKAALRFVAVLESHSYVGYAPALLEVMQNDARLLLDGWMTRAVAQGCDVGTGLAETTSTLPHVADVILAEARRWGADLIVIGSHGRSGVRRLVLGSVAEAVAHRSAVPVLIVHAADNIGT